MRKITYYLFISFVMIACVHKKGSNTVSTDSNNEDTIALSNVEKDSSTCTNSKFFYEAIEKFDTTAISLCAKGKPYKDAEHVVPDDNYDVVEITPEGKVIPRQEPVIPDYLDPNTIVDVVEQMPSFPGGQRALMDYIASNIRYPKSYNKVDQRIIVKFVVERDGSLSNITILKGSSEQALNDEALRVVREMPKWIPGKQYGIERRVVYTVPVNFKKE